MADDARKRAERDVDQMVKRWRREEKRNKFVHLFKKPMQYKRIKVPDWDARTRQLSAFRKAYADFFRDSIYEENSELQSHSTQLFWHRLYLQKLRMKRLGVTMQMESERVRRSRNPGESILKNDSFDGRYMASEVNEAIYSKRTFIQNGKEIGSFRDRESVNYRILSAKQQGAKEVICPNCGNTTTRENLIDGCDYCGTKFTVEDLKDRVDGFDFMFEVAKEGLSEKSWEARLSFSEGAGDMVRAHDPNFSFRSFKANIFNKMAALHYADSVRQVNAFSDADMSHLLEQYRNVVNIDFDTLYLWDDRVLVREGAKEKSDFRVEDGVQKIKCSVHMVLFELIDGKIQLRNEIVILQLEKAADCMTQNICGPSVFKCRGCGSSLSLADGKTCPYCGRELDMRQHDWVIVDYESRLNDPGKSWREYN